MDLRQQELAEDASNVVGKLDLFLGFLKIGLIGFGGIAPWARHVIIGDRFQGVPGVLLCLAGQMAMPLVIVTSLAMVYEHYSAVPEVKAALAGAAASAAGLVMGTALKMARKIRLTPLALLVAIIGVVAIGLLAWPLVPVVLMLVPLGIIAAALEQRA